MRRELRSDPSGSLAAYNRLMKRRLLISLLVLFASMRLASQTFAHDPLTIMSFNIRYGTAKDGENAWSARRAMLFDVLRDQNADLVGLQEALDTQIAEIVNALPGFGTIGVGRDDARSGGEFSAILFRATRFTVAEAGTFWFSDTPSIPASKSWGNTITRICTWARLIDRNGRGFWQFNVHLDHQSQQSRERSTELLRQRVESRAFPNEPVIITGDFNVGETNPAIATLAGGRHDNSVALFVDTFRVMHPQEREVGTFSGFKLGMTGGEKIDYIFVQPGTDVLHAEIVRTSRDGRYPSDHFPVVARVRLADKPER